MTGLERLQSLHWLAGTWRGADFEATYTSPEGGMILSASKAFTEGRVSFFEFERFHVEGDAVIFRPYPAGVGSALFRLAEHDPEARRAVFVNPAHDFPTELAYERVGDDQLVITVSGPGEAGGESRTVRFVLTRV